MSTVSTRTPNPVQRLQRKLLLALWAAIDVADEIVEALDGHTCEKPVHRHILGCPPCRLADDAADRRCHFGTVRVPVTCQVERGEGCRSSRSASCTMVSATSGR